jgi:putative DNA primase/helicase
MTQPAPKVVKVRQGLERKPFERGDHVELADRLATILRSEASTVFTDGQVWRYDHAAHIFKAAEPAQLSQIVQRFAGLEIRTGKKPQNLRLKAADIGGTIKLAQDQLTDSDFFASAPRGIVFENGFVRVTGERTTIDTHSPEHRARFAYPFEFNAKTYPNQLCKFLDEAFEGDADRTQKIRLIQEFVGLSMLGHATTYQAALVTVGDGANGKSVLTQVVEAAMPPGSSCAIPPQDFGQEYRRAMLAGKLLNVVSELPEAEILDAEAFKSVISGDSTTGREIRQAPFTFKPVAGHLFATNRLPGTQDQSHGFWRRFVVVTFNRVFMPHEQNRNLAKELIEQELPAIVGWFLAGAQRALLVGAFTIPESHQAALERWKQRADQVRAFLDDRCDKLPLSAELYQWTPAQSVYSHYRTWASNNGHRPVASNTFGERMRLLGLGSKPTMTAKLYPVAVRASGGAHE